MNATVFAHPAPQPTKLQIMIKKMSDSQYVMRDTAQYMQNLPSPYNDHARELLGAAAMVRMWIRDAEDDWK